MIKFPSVFESIKDLNKDQIEDILSLSRKMKNCCLEGDDPPHPFVQTPIIATSFLEDSTRTKQSFAVAVNRLGATYLDFNADSSSMKKGESLEETLKTLQCQGIDLCIIRTSQSHQFEEFKKVPPIRIINAGDGTHQHPTQALLDLYTIMEIGIQLSGMTMAIIGDCLHSRVGHSLIDLLPQFGVKIILCGPKEFLPSEGLPKGVSVAHDLDAVIDQSDLLYLLRIQKERHFGDQSKLYDLYVKDFGVSVATLKKHGKKLPVFHPGPANVGVEISEDLIKSPYYFGYQQVQNSVFVRMAIIQTILQNSGNNIGINIKPRTLADIT